MNDGEIPDTLTVRADEREFEVRVRLDTARDLDYYRHGGIMKVRAARTSDDHATRHSAAGHRVTALLHWLVSFVGRGRSERTIIEQQSYGRAFGGSRGVAAGFVPAASSELSR